MRLILLPALVVCCLLNVAAQNQTITLADGKEIDCTIRYLDKQQVIYEYVEDSVTISDTMQIADVYSIVYHNHAGDHPTRFYNGMFSTQGRDILAETDKKYQPLRNGITAEVMRIKGKQLVLGGGITTGIGALNIFTGAGIWTRHKGALTEWERQSWAIGLFSVGGIALVTGLSILPAGFAKLATAKHYKNESGKYVPTLSLMPATINPGDGFAPANGTGLQLTF